MKTIFENYWGIDVSKKWLDISIGAQTVRIDQTEDALEKFLSRVNENPIETLITLESTGGYEKLAVDFFLKKALRSTWRIQQK